MSKKSEPELKDLEQPVEELSTERAEKVEGGITTVGGKLLVPPGSPINTGIPGNPV